MSNIYIQEPPSNGKSGARVHCPRRRSHRHLDGGESIYGRQFKDEFHSRLHFNRRGLVAMANAGPHDNGSQFFFTLGRADELNNKHTIFGKVTGDTMYNMLRLAEMECDPEERPLNPHKLQTTEVLHSPFDDIIPCETKELQKDEDKKWGKKSQSKATKCLIYYYKHFLCSSLSICC